MTSVAAETEQMLDRDLYGLLLRTVDAHELLRLLRYRVGLTQESVATATGASLRSVRNWERGVQMRRDSEDRLRYLATVAAVLAGTLPPRGIVQWLHALNRGLLDRPIELLAGDEDEHVLGLVQNMVGDGLL